MNRPEVNGWEVTTNENGVKMATLNHKSLIEMMTYIEYLETKFKNLGIYSVINWVASTDKMPEEKGWYLVYVEGYSKEPKTCRCEYMGGHWWRHPNWGTIDEHVTYWGQIPKPPCL